MPCQQSFTIRVSSSVKAVHLLGSWDNYTGQLPLSREKGSSHSWKGTFKFSSSVLEAGQRYWYYFIIDGYHVAHNSHVESIREPTTGRELNILDVAKSSSKSSSRDKVASKRLTVEIPKGRPLSSSRIQCPIPVSPNATKQILKSDYDVNELTSRFERAKFDDEDIVTDFQTSSPVSSTGSSLSFRSDSSSGRSGYSTPSSDVECTCERYGITRKGDRVRLDCGGARCGYDSDCCSDEEYEVSRSSRRHAVMVR